MRVVFVGAGNLATRLSLEMRKSGMSIGQYIVTQASMLRF